MSLLDIRDLSIDFPVGDRRLSAVRGVSLQVARGECLGVVGESGSGKSLTALSILGLLPRGAERRAGRIALGGDDLIAMGERRLAAEVRGRRVGFIFQEPMTSLNPVYSIGRQLTEVMLRSGASAADAGRRALVLLDRVGIASARERLSAYPHQLSGGQRQRVMIAMALMNQPQLLIADEPTTALDVTVQAQILALLAELQREFDMGLLLISHNLGAIAQVADRVAVMYAGEVVETAPSATLFAEPRHPYTRALLDSLPGATRAGRGEPLQTIPGVVGSFFGEPAGCVFAARCALSEPGCTTQRPPLHGTVTGPSPRWSRCIHGSLPARVAPGQAVDVPVPSGAVPTGPKVLEALQLSRSYPVGGGFLRRPRMRKAVDDVSLTVGAGEILAIVGESGCGKSTLARMLVGLESADEGVVNVSGKALFGRRRMERARDVQLVFQDPYSSLNPSRSVRAVVGRPLDILREGSAKERAARVDAMLHAVGLPARLHDVAPGQLSGGQRQRVAIARALVTSPRLVVCDEPTSALDVSVQAQILNLLLSLRRELGLSLVLISHDLAVVAHMADRIAVMQSGQVVECGSASQVFGDPRHPYTRSLLQATPVLDRGADGAG